MSKREATGDMSADQNRAAGSPVEVIETDDASGGNTIDANSGRAAEFIFGHALKPLMNWTQAPGNQFHTWTFIPGSLNGIKHIKTKGVRGVHYAIGELELCKMLLTYGLFHAPRDLNDIPAEMEEVRCIYDMKDWVEKYCYSTDLEESKFSSKEAKSASAKREKSGKDEGSPINGKRMSTEHKYLSNYLTCCCTDSAPKRSGAHAAKNTSTSSRKRGNQTRNQFGQADKKSKPAAGTKPSNEQRKEVLAQVDTARVVLLRAELAKVQEKLNEALDILSSGL